MIERESEAWRALAERFDRYGMDCWLCHQLEPVFADKGMRRLDIAPVTRKAMLSRIALDVGRNMWNDTNSAYLASEGSARELRDARVLACLMFAEEAADAERLRAKRKRERAQIRANTAAVISDALGFGAAACT